jgi:hypothetical protein
MRFRFVKFYALLLAGLLPAGSLVAQTNSAPAEQPIIFSSPNGETVSNALLPVAEEAPSPSALADMVEGAPESIAFPQMPVARLPRPALMHVQRNNAQSLLDEDGTGLATPSQIMGVPTMQEIFGLPKPYATYDEKKDKDNSSPQDAQTNSISSEDANWAKILSGDTDQSAFAPDKSKSPRLIAGFFESVPTDASGKTLQDKYQEQDDSVFGSSAFSQTPAEHAAFSPPAQLSQVVAPEPAPAFSPPPPSFNASAFSPGLNSQSPFALPASASLGTLPQLPSLPVAVFQNNAAPPPPVPSWAPKPAPWLSQVPPLGTMEQRKF